MIRSLRDLCLTVAVCLPGVAIAAPVTLSVVNVLGTQIKCVFETDCAIPEQNGQTNFAIPGASGTGQLQVTTFAGKGGIPVQVKHAYQYRIDLAGATAIGDSSCILGMQIDFGPALKLQYNKTGPLDDVFVINVAGPGVIGLASAVQDHNTITFTFAQPICAGDGVSQGKSSFFFGLASAAAPAIINAKIDGAGFGPLNVRASAPAH